MLHEIDQTTNTNSGKKTYRCVQNHIFTRFPKLVLGGFKSVSTHKPGVAKLRPAGRIWPPKYLGHFFKHDVSEC